MGRSSTTHARRRALQWAIRVLMLVAAMSASAPALALTVAPMCGDTPASVIAPMPAPAAQSGELRAVECEDLDLADLGPATPGAPEALPLPAARGDQAAATGFSVPPIPRSGVQPAGSADLDPARSGINRPVFRPPRA